MDSHKPSYELRVRNVSLHRRGKPETGTLYVTQHHLIFSYVPTAAETTRRVVSRQQPSNLSGESTESDKAQLMNENAQPHGEAPAEQRQQKARPKEVYVPYPLIQKCTLRPSVTQGGFRTAVGETDGQPHDRNGEDEMFPPTFGTSTAGRPSTDSTHGPPRRPASPLVGDGTATSSRPPAIRLRCKDFNILALHFHSGSSDKSADDHARQVFYSLRDRCCVHNMEEMYAFSFQPPGQELSTGGQKYDAIAEFARMGITHDAPSDGPGKVWRITEINTGYAYSTTYPQVLVVPRNVSDNILKYCGSFRSKARIPALAYLHPNGGSITRSSQPLVGVQGKRNPQDEKLVSAIFCSHIRAKNSPEDTPPNESSLAGSPPMSFSETSSAIDVDLDVNHTPANENLTKPRVYGSTRRNLIVDARPKINMIANKAAGGGIEDVANYQSPASDVPVEKVFLNIANIHAMRSSLERVVDALGNADYIDLPPAQEALRKSGWLGHIAGILDGAEMVARVVGLGASHALIHCSDGWDRTSQISALAQVMLEPHYRTLNGFITLVQKDFLAFGHKFRHRQGIEGSEKWFEIENERVQPGRTYQSGGGPTDGSNFQALGSKALSGARSWFEKNRSNLFRQPGPQSSSPESTSRPRTPPANPLLHSVPSPTVKEEKHKMDEKEVAPIFHQFLDAVYQLMYQEPTAFEFNERFLRRLFYHSYSGQYSEFLYNSEKERSHAEDRRLPSVWAYFLARTQEFKNPEYATIAGGGLIFPRRHGYARDVDVRWWNALFGRKDEEMNVPKALAPVDVPSIAAQLSSVSLDEGPSLGLGDTEAGALGGAIRSARSTPALHSTLEEVDGNPRKVSSISSIMSFDGAADQPDRSEASHNHISPAFAQAQPVDDVWSDEGINLAVNPTKQSKAQNGSRPADAKPAAEEGDPLGITKKVAPVASNGGAGRLDFAAFAQQNAFSER